MGDIASFVLGIVTCAATSHNWRCLRELFYSDQYSTIALQREIPGYEAPHPPDALVAYDAFLEEGEEFSSTWIWTDYRFESLEEAVALTGFSFGESMADRVISKDPVILPECTGIWWLTV